MAPTLLGLAATVLAAGAALVGLSGPLPPRPRPRPVPGRLAQTPPPAGLVPATAADPLVGRLIDAEAQALATERGLPLGRPLTVRVLDRAHLAAERNALMTARRPAAEARAEASLRWRLGIGGD